MDISRLNHPMTQAAITEAYTDLHGLQNLKTEQNQDLALKKVAQQFESLFVSMMLKSMRSANAVFEEGGLFQSKESDFYRDMLDYQRSLSLTQGRGLGIAEVLYRQMSGRHDRGESEATGTVPLTSKKNPVAPLPPNQNHNEFESPADFVQKLYPHARRAAERIGVDPEILIAQSALETGWGKKLIQGTDGSSSNNFFNIKTGAAWSGERIGKEVLEYKNDSLVKERADFRRYADIAESFQDYADFILQNPRYRTAVTLAKDGKAYIEELAKAGFATDPEYATKVTRVREQVGEKLGTMVRDLLSTTLRGAL